MALDSKKRNQSDRLNDIGVPFGNIDMNSQKITNLYAGSNPGDAVRFDQLQSVQNAGYTKTEVDQKLDLKYDLSFGVTNTAQIGVLQNDKANKTDVTDSLALKEDKTVVSALATRVTAAETKFNDYNTKAQDTSLFKPIA